jgi:histidinol-phosphate aminotransferase
MFKLMQRREWLQASGAAILGSVALPLIGNNVFPRPQKYDSHGPVRMNLNENPYGPSPKVFEKFMDFSAEYSQYPGPAFTELRDMAAGVIGVRPEQLVVMNGSVEVLKTAGLLAQRKGGTIISPRPTYDNLVVFGEHLGATVRWIPLTSDMQTDLEAMSAAINSDTGMVYLCNPANPTGLHISHKKLLAFVDSIPKDVLVFVDEAYAELATAGDYKSLTPWLDEYPNMIISRTMSKAYGLAGFRIGYGIASESLAAELNQLRTTYVTAVGVRAAMTALEDVEWLQRCKDGIVAERERITRFLRDRNVRVVNSETNFVWYHTGIDAAEYQNKFRPLGFITGRPFAPHNDWCRLSIPGREDLTRFMQAYDQLFG